jgi:hypothetical protein
MPKEATVKSMNEFILMFNNRVIGKGVSLTDNYDRGVQDVEEIGNYFVEETVPTIFSGTLTRTSLELSAGTLEELAIVPDGSKDEDMKFSDIVIVEASKKDSEAKTVWYGCDNTGGSITRAPHAIVGRNVTWRYKRRKTTGAVVA